MSYSFNVRAATKAEAKEAVKVEFGRVLDFQPEHERDLAVATQHADAVIDLLGDETPDGYEITVSCNGYISWDANQDKMTAPLRGVSAACNAAFCVKG